MRIRPPLAALVLGSAAVLAACGSSGGHTTTAVTTAGPGGTAVVGTIGDLQVVGPYLPQPASPSVAAVYLTIRNTGSTSDRLVSVSSPDASSGLLMTEDERGMTGMMMALPDLVVPAHGSASLIPGHDHAMLEKPSSSLAVGQEIPVVLRFAHAGSLTVQVPVVPLSAEVGGGS